MACKRLLRYILQNERLMFILRCMKNINNDEFLYEVNHYKESIMMLKMVQRGERNRGKIVYDLNADIDNGFCNALMFILQHLNYADSLNLYPIVTLGSKFPYYEENGVGGEMNPWEYYFEQYDGLSVEDLEDSFRVVEFSHKKTEKLFGEENDNDISYQYQIGDKYIKDLGKIMHKYVSLNSKSKKYIEQGTDILNNKKTLGVHMRGGDMLVGWKNHMVVPSNEEYVIAIDEAMDIAGFEQIFLATDDERPVQMLRKRYGKKLVYYEDVIRVQDTTSAYRLPVIRENHKYLCGLEMLRDLYTLVECKGLVASISSVDICAQIIKCSREEEFEYKKILNKGINIKGPEISDIRNKKKYIKS